MLGQLFLGMVLIVLTVLVHGMSLDWLLRLLEKILPIFRAILPRFGRPLTLSVTVLGVFLAHVLEIWIWAIVLLFTREMHNLESALYFSIVTFTTVGYGDVTLTENWRMLGSIEAANGMLLFGWSTAFIFEAMRWVWNLYAKERDPHSPQVS